MKRNKVLPYNKDAKAFKGSERAQSDSSLEMFANCPAAFAYNYGLFAHRGKPEKFVWFIYGSMIHQIADNIRTDILINKKVDPWMSKEDEKKYLSKWNYQARLAMDPKFAYEKKGVSEDFIYIPRDSIERMGQERYTKLEEEKREAYLAKARNTIRAVYYSTRIQTKFTTSKYEWRFSSQKFRAPNLHDERLPIWLLGAFDEINYMMGDNPYYTIVDLKSGNKNNLKLEKNHQMLMYYYVASNIDHASPSKKDGPRREELTMFNGMPPRQQYLVSLDIEPWAIKKHGDEVLHSEDFKLRVENNFDVEWPEHHKFISDVATVQHYMLKGYGQQGNLLAPIEFEPLSIRGKRIEIGRSMSEQRFVPRVGQRCGLCPAKQWCQEDHPDDWDKYREEHGLGVYDTDKSLVIDPDIEAAELEDTNMLLPDDDYQPKYVEVQQLLNLSGRGASKYNIFIPKTVPKRKLKEMQSMNFMQVRSVAANLKKFVHQIPYLENGTKCQCMGFKDLILLPVLLVFVKYNAGDWSLVFDASVIHNFLLLHCPLEDCLRKAEHKAKQEQTKESIQRFKEDPQTIELGILD